ncbi:YceI family protein [Spirillospora sp. NPDC029432]|uniref:YceI family protein n=1 Tax=Spirillospora sp. NPDC029432 TaxID=3154599 RepID=UPI003456779B
MAPDLIAGRWSIDPAHSEVTFTIRHLMTTVRGSFPDFQGEIRIAADPLASSASAEIAMGSIDTRSAERDAHVRSSEILDVERYPAMTFVGTGVERAAIGRRARHPRYHLDGELTIRNVTRPVRLLVEFHGIENDPWGGTRAGFTATTALSRRDFGIEFNVPLQGDKVMLGETIAVQLEIQAVLDAPAGAHDQV